MQSIRAVAVCLYSECKLIILKLITLLIYSSDCCVSLCGLQTIERFVPWIALWLCVSVVRWCSECLSHARLRLMFISLILVIMLVEILYLWISTFVWCFKFITGFNVYRVIVSSSFHQLSECFSYTNCVKLLRNSNLYTWGNSVFIVNQTCSA